MKKFIFSLVAASVFGLFFSACHPKMTGGSVQKERDITTKEEQKNLSPAAALDLLKAGNARFLAGKPIHSDYLFQIKETAEGQNPFAVVLSCLDSRIPVEEVFDRGIGDLFVARVAGNFANTDILGSMEFGTKVVGAKLILVLGHTSCGAVKGCIDGAKLGNLHPATDVQLAHPGGH